MLSLSQKIRSTYTICLLGLFLTLANLFTFKNEILGTFGFLLYFVPVSYQLGKKLFDREKIENFLLGLLFTLCEIIISGTVIYYLYKITPLISYFLLLIPLFTLLFLRRTFSMSSRAKSRDLSHPEIPPCAPLGWNDKLHSYLLPVVIIALDIFLLLYLSTHRTYDLAASPWLQITPLFFALYTLATLLLFFNYRKNLSSTQNIITSSLHFFVGLSVAALIYPLGYGFDAFIHRATETWIQNNGFINPKQPYYIGQYSLVVFLSNITQIKIFFVDVFLVPLLSAIFIPGIVFTTLKKIFPSTNPLLSSLAFWIIPFVPFLSLQLTTPHNFVLLLSILLVFLNFSYIRKETPFFLPLLVSLAAIMTHPLIGTPGLVFTLGIFALQKFEDKKNLTKVTLGLIFLALCFLLPVLFTLNGLRIGTPLPNITNPFTHVSTFFELFKHPYWYASTSPLRFEILYFCERLIVPIVILLSLYGFRQYRKSSKSLIAWIFPITALALFVDAWLLRSWIVFPGVVAYEQGDYPMRLIHTSIIFLLPFAMYGFSTLIQSLLSFRLFHCHSEPLHYGRDKLRRGILINILIIILAITLSTTLYLSYPQRNSKVRFPGYNVTQSDFKAIQWIHKQNSEYNYIVLANQLVSAAALTDYSFAKYFDTSKGELFYYSIPTGAEMYKYYGKMIYEGQKREYMEEAMKIAGVKKAYLVVNSYWANADKIIAGAKLTANSSYSIDMGKVWIFEYTRK